MFGRQNLLTAALLATSCLRGVSAAHSAGCGKDPTISDGTYTTEINGQEREYIVKLPKNYDNTKPHMLIFTFHALGGTAAQIANGEEGALPFYGLPPLAKDNAIFVSPDGIDNGWANIKGEDIDFVDDMMATIEDDLCVDEDLRFATGFSFGASMSYSLACARPEHIRAVAVLSGGRLSGCEDGNKPVAFYIQHGTEDATLPIKGGINLRDDFVEKNGCTPLKTEPEPGKGGASTKVEYEGCKDGYPVTWVVFDGVHEATKVDPGACKPFAPGNTWEFFSQFL